MYTYIIVVCFYNFLYCRSFHFFISFKNCIQSLWFFLGIFWDFFFCVVNFYIKFWFCLLDSYIIIEADVWILIKLKIKNMSLRWLKKLNIFFLTYIYSSVCMPKFKPYLELPANRSIMLHMNRSMSPRIIILISVQPVISLKC